MPYSDFTLSKLEKRFGIKHRLVKLFDNQTNLVLPSLHLVNDIQDASDIPMLSEKAKSELIITPIIRELRKNNRKNFTFFSGYTFDVDVEKELNGVCDYLLSKVIESVEIKSPVFCIVEAKNRAIEEGWGQCGAEMYAARLFNQANGEEISPLFGAVTNAYEWSFLKLENDTLQIDTERYVLKNLSELLGVLQHIISKY
jgi:hypothetical protein